MDDFRVGSVSPYDPIERRHPDDSAGRRRRKLPEQPAEEEQDVVALSEPAEESPAQDEPGAGYGPRREQS